MTTLEFHVVVWLKSASVVAFGNVDLFLAAVVVRNFYVDLCISIAAVRISVAVEDIDISVMTIN